MRLATFNIESLGGDRRTGAPIEDRIAVLRPQLERLRAEVLCLQEINTRKAGGTRQPADLKRLLAGTPYAEHALEIAARPGGDTPADVHNPAILTRLPVVEREDIHQRLVAPPSWQNTTAIPPGEAPQPMTWDRPIQRLALALPDGRHLHVFNVHLRAPLAAPIAGQKDAPFVWKSVAGWAEGYFVSAMKRSGQALELRLAAERVFDADPDALIAVCGDFNAEDHDTALRLACAGEDDTGSGRLAGRVLTPVERSLPADRRYTVVHHGRPQMPDHILASRALFGRLASVEIHNEMLEDELVAFGRIDRPPESLHAPMVAEFAI
ncbi:endonuclease/exonuclease/phosphatase family protein [Microbaculum marinum]|uniref:Endonuclease/exonuclease/phosphatase family protein n=1 Tax=Microbaculum marinum TaxID=1764581 RepID=A0AAW9RSS1_9HYPH